MNETALMGAIMEFMPVMEKYGSVTPEYLKIKIQKYNEGIVIKMASDKIEVTEALTELMLLMSKMNTDVKVTCEIEDKRSLQTLS